MVGGDSVMMWERVWVVYLSGEVGEGMGYARFVSVVRWKRDNEWCLYGEVEAG